MHTFCCYSRRSAVANYPDANYPEVVRGGRNLQYEGGELFSQYKLIL
jgi:hypothetical protein